MIPILIALAAPAAAAGSPEARFISCAEDVRKDPGAALASAQGWVDKGGGTSARHCPAMAYAASERWPEAATAFDNAAAEAERTRDSRAAELRAAAGNAWLAAGDAAKARKALDQALIAGIDAPELEGEAYLDRARALVALDDPTGARADLDKGLGLVPGDPFGWYLSAALAQREGDLARAKTDIAKAVAGAPDDAEVLLLAGNIAGLAGELDQARTYFTRAARAAPDSPAGKAASAALAANAASEPEPAPTR